MIERLDGQNLYLKDQCAIGHDSPRWEATFAVGVIRSGSNPGNLANSHSGDALIPGLDYLTESDGERKWLLSGIFRAPKWHRQVPVLALWNDKRTDSFVPS